jgi:hypothetical protein
MGLLDLPGPLICTVDSALLPGSPSAVRLALWGALAGVAAMLLYWAFSPQASISATKRELARTRRALDAYDGEFAGAGGLIGAMLVQALRQVGLVLLPTLLAALPVLCLIAWLGGAYGYFYPTPSMAVPVRAVPDDYSVAWRDTVASPGALRKPAELVVTDRGGREVGSFPLAAAVPVLHKRHWWNRLMENPAGYLPDETPLERIEIALPRQEFIHVGPLWTRGWEALFFAALSVSALLVKLLFRIK